MLSIGDWVIFWQYNSMSTSVRKWKTDSSNEAFGFWITKWNWGTLSCMSLANGTPALVGRFGDTGKQSWNVRGSNVCSHLPVTHLLQCQGLLLSLWNKASTQRTDVGLCLRLYSSYRMSMLGEAGQTDRNRTLKHESLKLLFTAFNSWVEISEEGRRRKEEGRGACERNFLLHLHLGP